MGFDTNAILVASIVLQFVAAFLALRLIKTTKTKAWYLISSALVFMGLRRLVTLIGSFYPSVELFFKGLLAESIALLISFLMVAGVFLIASFFRAKLEVEEALKASEEKYSALVEKGNDGIVIIQDGLLKFVNPKITEITGFSKEEVIGRPFSDFVSPEYKELVLDRYRKRMSGEEVPNRYEIEIFSKDGRKTLLEINACIIEYKGRSADMAILRDITERKRAEEELRKHREHLEELVKERTKDLEEKTRELERFNRLFVGRELKIIELKEEVKRLKEELKRRGG